jgi:hypothetical protein
MSLDNGKCLVTIQLAFELGSSIAHLVTNVLVFVVDTTEREQFL